MLIYKAFRELRELRLHPKGLLSGLPGSQSIDYAGLELLHDRLLESNYYQFRHWTMEPAAVGSNFAGGTSADPPAQGQDSPTQYSRPNGGGWSRILADCIADR